MAKDLNTSNLSVAAEDGVLKVVSMSGEARLGAVYLDGERLDGVFAEVQPGGIEGLAADGGAYVPAGIKQRDAFLKKWSVAAEKASKAKKAGGMSVLLLSLAACGGGGGEAPTVKTAEVGASSVRIDISSASVGAVITVESATDSAGNVVTEETFSDVSVIANGSGTLTLSFEDANDTVVLDSSTSITGFDTIVVAHGTVDFTAVDLPASITVIEVGSEAILSYSDFTQMTAIGLRTGATEGTIKVIVSSVAEARAVDTSDELHRDVTVEVALSGNDAGEISLQDYADLKRITAEGDAGENDGWAYDLVDDVSNFFNDENDEVALKAGVLEAVQGADGVTIVGILDAAQWAVLVQLAGNEAIDLSTFDIRPFALSIELSDSALKIGETATATIKFNEAVTGFNSDEDVTVENGTLSLMT